MNADKEASSVVTFKCTKETIESVDCRTFLLENVDMEESKQSSSDDNNLDLIVRQLEELAGGFWLRVYKVLTRDFGLPQRRIRLFFLGVSKRHYPDFNMDVVTKHLEAFKLQCQSPDSFFEMLCTLFFFSELIVFSVSLNRKNLKFQHI